MPGAVSEYLASAVVVRRSRARTHDLVLRVLTREGAVLALYVRNGRSSQRRLAGLDNGFGISEIRWSHDSTSGNGSLCGIESHRPATWLADARAYAWYCALIELLAHELQPGMHDERLAAMVHGVLAGDQGPGLGDFVAALSLLGHCPPGAVALEAIGQLVRDRLGLRAPFLQLALATHSASLEMA